MRKKGLECLIDEIVLDGLEGVDSASIGPLIHHHLNEMAGPNGFSTNRRGLLNLGDLNLELDARADENAIGRAVAQAIYSQLSHL